jgi:hypothetical protein
LISGDFFDGSDLKLDPEGCFFCYFLNSLCQVLTNSSSISYFLLNLLDESGIFFGVVHIDPLVVFGLAEVGLDCFYLVGGAVEGYQVAEGSLLELLFQPF